MCGIGHAMMAGRIIVETQQDHAAWLMRGTNPAVAQQQAPPESAANGDTNMAEMRR
jgi:heme/copper-type cytochrome/quinol oxidase subunit 2